MSRKFAVQKNDKGDLMELERIQNIGKSSLKIEKSSLKIEKNILKMDSKVKEFSTSEEIRSNGANYFSVLKNEDLHKDISRIFKIFTDNGYLRMNYSERISATVKINESSQFETSDVKMINDVMSEELKKHTIKKEIVVYKGIDMQRFEMMLGFPVRNDFEDKKAEMVGKILRDKGFVSTSVLRERAFNDKEFLLKIKVPPGANGAYIGSISEIPGETELLLDRDQTFKITSIRQYRFSYIVECDLLPKEITLQNIEQYSKNEAKQIEEIRNAIRRFYAAI